MRPFHHRPSHVREDAVEFRQFGDRPLNAFANRPRLRRLRNECTGHFSQFGFAVERHYEVNQVLDDRRLIMFAPELVVDAVKTFGSDVLPFLAASLPDDRTSVGESAEQGRYGTNVHTRPRRNRASG